MTQQRSRSRWKNYFAPHGEFFLSGVKVGTQECKADTRYEYMVDWVIEGWHKMKALKQYLPEVNYPRKMTLSAAVRDGYLKKYRQLATPIPPINSLQYTAVRSLEELGDVVFRVPSQPLWIQLKNGCMTQMLDNMWRGNWGSNPPTPVEPASLLVAKSQHELLKKVSKPRFGFGEPIGEIGHLVRTLKNPFAELARFEDRMIDDLGKKRFFSLVDNRKDATAAAALYAQVQFALRPTIKTIDDSMQAHAAWHYEKRTNWFKPISVETQSVGRGAKIVPDNRPFPWSGTTSHRYWFKRLVEIDAENSGKAGAWYYHDDSGSIANLLGLRAVDFPVTMWELFPLSFIYDRLYNFKGCLEALRTFLSSSVKVRNYYAVSRQSVTKTRRFMDIQPTSTGPYPGYGCSVRNSNPWIEVDFSLSRSSWEPQPRQIFPPKSAVRLADTINHTLDTIAVTVLKLDKWFK